MLRTCARSLVSARSTCGIDAACARDVTRIHTGIIHTALMISTMFTNFAFSITAFHAIADIARFAITSVASRRNISAQSVGTTGIRVANIN